MIFEQDLKMTTSINGVKGYLINLSPEIYKFYRESKPFTVFKFFKVFVGGILQSLVIFFFPLMIFHLQSLNGLGNVTQINSRLPVYGIIVYAVL